MHLLPQIMNYKDIPVTEHCAHFCLMLVNIHFNLAGVAALSIKCSLKLGQQGLTYRIIIFIYNKGHCLTG